MNNLKIFTSSMVLRTYKNIFANKKKKKNAETKVNHPITFQSNPVSSLMFTV